MYLANVGCRCQRTASWASSLIATLGCEASTDRACAAQDTKAGRAPAVLVSLLPPSSACQLSRYSLQVSWGISLEHNCPRWLTDNNMTASSRRRLTLRRRTIRPPLRIPPSRSQRNMISEESPIPCLSTSRTASQNGNHPSTRWSSSRRCPSCRSLLPWMRT